MPAATLEFTLGRRDFSGSLGFESVKRCLGNKSVHFRFLAGERELAHVTKSGEAWEGRGSLALTITRRKSVRKCPSGPG